MSLRFAEAQKPTETERLWLYNRNLDNESHVGLLHEAVFEEKLRELEWIGRDRDHIYWLTLARLNELVLLCAGNYADSGEITAVGDLLVNPRLIVIHIKKRSQPVVKERHTALTQQFAHVAENRFGVIQWLKKKHHPGNKEKTASASSL